jgi:hypothetical protein
MVMSGLLKPTSRLTKRLLETRFTVHKQLTTKPASVLTAKSVSRNKDSGTAFSKVCTISKGFHISSLNINFWISQELRSKKNVKTISSPEGSTNWIFQKLKCNPIVGETVPLNFVLNNKTNSPSFEWLTVIDSIVQTLTACQAYYFEKELLQGFINFGVLFELSKRSFRASIYLPNNLVCELVPISL